MKSDSWRDGTVASVSAKASPSDFNAWPPRTTIGLDFKWGGGRGCISYPQENISGLIGGWIDSLKLQTLLMGDFGIPRGLMFYASCVLPALTQSAPRTNKIRNPEGWNSAMSYCSNFSGDSSVQLRLRATALNGADFVWERK